MTSIGTPATGSRHSAAYVAEAAYGVTPADPAFQILRSTGVTLALSKETIQSEELRSDRQIAGFKHGNKSVGGDINFELSFASFDDFLEAALGGTWTNDTLKAGTNRKSFTIERLFSDIDKYLRYTGCEVNTLSLSVAPNAMVTGTFGLVGQGAEPSSSAPLVGAEYTEPNTNTPFDSFSGSMTINGATSSVITSIELSLENGLEPAYVVGSAETIRPSIGRSNVTGTLSAYLTDMSLIDSFTNEDEIALAFTLSGDGGNYVFSLPRIKFGSGSPEVSGDSPIIPSMEFQALFDATAGSNLVITRRRAE